jgi:hypothetical protein
VEWPVEGPELGSVAYAQPLRMHKVNIGTKKKPNFAHIDEYWNYETM